MRPDSEADLAAMIRAAAGPLTVTGGASRRLPGEGQGTGIDMTGITGITLYEPEALTLVVRAGTPWPRFRRHWLPKTRCWGLNPIRARARPSGGWRQAMHRVRAGSRPGPAGMRCWACGW